MFASPTLQFDHQVCIAYSAIWSSLHLSCDRLWYNVMIKINLLNKWLHTRLLIDWLLSPISPNVWFSFVQVKPSKKIDVWESTFTVTYQAAEFFTFAWLAAGVSLSFACDLWFKLSRILPWWPEVSVWLSVVRTQPWQTNGAFAYGLIFHWSMVLSCVVILQ